MIYGDHKALPVQKFHASVTHTLRIQVPNNYVFATLAVGTVGKIREKYMIVRYRPISHAYFLSMSAHM